jgi:hypothetical protein
MADRTLAPTDSPLDLGSPDAPKDNLLAFVDELLGYHLRVIQQLWWMFSRVVLLWSRDSIHGQPQDEQCGKYDCPHMKIAPH